MAQRISNLSIGVTANTSGLTRGLTNAEKKLQKFDRQTHRLRKSMSRLSRTWNFFTKSTLGGHLGAIAITRGLSSITGAFGDMRQEIDTLAKVSRDINEPIDRVHLLSSALKQLGIEGRKVPNTLRQLFVYLQKIKTGSTTLTGNFAPELLEELKEINSVSDLFNKLQTLDKTTGTSLISLLGGGRQSARLITGVQTGELNEAIKASEKLFNSLGIKLTNDLGPAIEAVNDAQSRFKDGLTLVLADALSPATNGVREFDLALSGLLKVLHFAISSTIKLGAFFTKTFSLFTKIPSATAGESLKLAALRSKDNPLQLRGKGGYSYLKGLFARVPSGTASQGIISAAMSSENNSLKLSQEITGEGGKSIPQLTGITASKSVVNVIEKRGREFNSKVKAIGEEIGSAFSEAQWDIINGASTVKSALRGAFNSIFKSAYDQIVGSAYQSIGSSIAGAFSGFLGLGGGTPAAKASGGMATAGVYKLGERGNEFVMNALATQKYSDVLKRMNAGQNLVGNSGQEVKQYFNIQSGVSPQEFTQGAEVYAGTVRERLLAELQVPNSEARNVIRGIR